MRNIGSHTFKSLALLAALLLAAAPARAVISIGPAGVSPLTFDTAPTGTDFLSAYIGGGGATFTNTAQVDALMAGLNASALTPDFQLAQSATAPPSPFAYGFRYNTTGLYLQSRATTQSGSTNNPTSAAVLLLASLRNDTGATQAGLEVSYDTATNSPVTGELPGFRAYYSVSGAAGTWQPIPALSGVETNGRLVARLNLGAWANGSALYLAWFDDNANSITDPGYTIDNLALNPITTFLTAATNLVVEERQLLGLHSSFAGAGLTYQWYFNGSPVIEETTCVNGGIRRIAGANEPTLRLGHVQPADAGQYQCVASSGGLDLNGFTATIDVNPDTTAPRILYASPGTNAGQYLLHLSEPLNDACLPIGGGLVTQPSTWYIDEIFPGGGESPLGLAGFLNTPDVTGSLLLGLIAGTPPSSPTNPVRITLVENLADTSVAQNILPFSTVVYVNNFSNELVSFSHPWRYNDTDVNPGPNWFQPGYDASAFPQGPGPFDAKRAAGGAAGADCRDTITFYGLGPVGTCIRLLSPVPPGTNALVTANFWTKFHFGGDPAGATLRWQGKMDDGAVIYLNGQELQRLRMPAAPAVITRATLASGGVGDGDAQDAFEFISPPALRRGENTLAVELHQATIGSSDFTMAMQVSAISTPAPQLQMNFNGTDVTVTWQPDYGVLEYSDTLAPGSWSAVPGGFNGYSEPAAGTRYFRVKMP